MTTAPEKAAAELLAELPPSPAVWCTGLRKQYGRRHAVEGVGLTVGRGEVVGLLGPNGAGKTTVIKMLLGLVTPDAGEVMLLGRPGDDPLARASVGYLPELFRYQPWLTAGEVVDLHVRLSGADVSAADRRAVLTQVGLGARIGDRAGTFSKGMQQRLGLAVALVARPDLVILDEPTSALDPVGRVEVRDLVLSLKSRGVAVLLNSHLIGEVERVCDRVVILDKGRVAASGTLLELLGQHEVRLHLTDVPADVETRLAATGTVTREGDWFTVALRRRRRGGGAGPRPRPGRPRRPDPRRRTRPDQPGGAPARHPAPRRRGGGAVIARTVLTIAGLTLREASRRKVLRSIGVLTVALLVLSAWGFSRLAAEGEFGSLTSGESRLVASQLLNLVMFGMSLITALGTAFLAGPTVAGEIESGIALSVLARPVRRWAVLLGQVARAGRLRQRVRRRRGAGAVPRRPADRRLLAAAARRRHAVPRRPDGRAAHARPAAVERRLPHGVRASWRSASSGPPGSPAWSGGIGQALGNDGVAQVGVISRIILPTDGLWRGAMHALQDPAALSQFGFEMEGFPFLSEASLSPVYLGWVVLWVAMVWGLTALAFNRRDV